MKNYNSIIVLVKLLIEQAEAYKERPTKIQSQKIRVTLNTIKQGITKAKTALVEQDKL